jgi:hypothetical protein
MAENKTKLTALSVDSYLDAIVDEDRRKGCKQLVRLMSKVSGQKAKMWGTSIVGFGSYHYKYESGREGDAPLIGFSSRKGDITVYLMLGTGDYESLLSRLGKHKTGKGCLYVKRMADVDEAVLSDLVSACMDALKRRYAASAAR